MFTHLTCAGDLREDLFPRKDRVGNHDYNGVMYLATVIEQSKKA